MICDKQNDILIFCLSLHVFENISWFISDILRKCQRNSSFKIRVYWEGKIWSIYLDATRIKSWNYNYEFSMEFSRKYAKLVIYGKKPLTMWIANIFKQKNYFHRGLNKGPLVFYSDALQTELTWHFLWDW